MKKFLTCTLLLGNMLLILSCSRFSERELAQYFNNRYPVVTMPYDNPQYLLHAVPEYLPFPYTTFPNSELLGTIEDNDEQSGTILLKTDGSAGEILDFYTQLLSSAAFTNTSESQDYRVFFQPNESGATFCNGQKAVVLLEIFELLEESLKDVRLHYTTNPDAISRTTCGQSIQLVEEFPFPHFEAPPNSTILGGGGGGGGNRDGTRKGRLGYVAEVVIETDDSLEFVYNYYANALEAEGWVQLNQSSNDNFYESDWDFGFYTTRSWLGRLVVSVAEVPNQYIIKLQAVSP